MDENKSPITTPRVKIESKVSKYSLGKLSGVSKEYESKILEDIRNKIIDEEEVEVCSHKQRMKKEMRQWNKDACCRIF